MDTASIGDERAATVRHAQRVTGQIAALVPMIAAQAPFTEVAQQLLAARGSLDSLLVRLVELEVRVCVGSARTRAEIVSLLQAALGRRAHGRLSTGLPRQALRRQRAVLTLEGTTSP